jgi:hypothetical protein
LGSRPIQGITRNLHRAHGIFFDTFLHEFSVLVSTDWSWFDHGQICSNSPEAHSK